MTIVQGQKHPEQPDANYTDVNRKDMMPEKYILSTCLPLVAMPLSNTKPSRMHSGYFKLRHKAAIKTSVFRKVMRTRK